MIRCSVFMACALLSCWVSASPHPQIDDLFHAYTNDSPGCALSISQNGKTLLEQGYGSANLEYDIPISKTTRFYAASTTKQFTALAVALLAQDGKLAITDSVRKYLPHLPDYTNDITIDHLLRHTDGLRDYFTLLFFQGQGYDNELPPTEIFKLIARQQSPNFEPGTEFLYANSGYLLLAKVIEAAAGKTLAEFSQEHIFGPLEMRDTKYVDDFRTLIPQRAEGYIEANKGWLSPRSRFAEIGPSGLVTTAVDLSKWLNAIHNRTFGKALDQQLFSKGKLKDGQSIDYGYGFFIQSYRGLEVRQHGGARPGYHSNLAFVPQLGLGIALLCNHSSIDAIATTNSIIELIAGPKVIEPSLETAVSPQTLKSLEGLYLTESNAGIEITAVGKHLYAQAAGQGRYEIFPTSDFEYFWKVADIQATFHKNEKNEIASLIIKQGGSETLAIRSAPVARAKPDKQLDDYVGQYWSEELATNYVFSIRDQKLMLAIDGQQGRPLTRESEDRFAILGATIEFRRDSKNRVDSLLVSAARARNLAFHKR